MVLTTIDNFGIHPHVVIDMVTGSVVKSLPNEWSGDAAEQYKTLLKEARDEAAHQMMDHAVAMDGHAVLGVQFTTTTLGDCLVEVLATGTAVKFL